MSEHNLNAAAGAERLEIVASSARLVAVGPDWTALWQRLDGLIFQSHAWISAWWETVPDQAKRELRIGLLWNGDRLIAVVPLAISRRKNLRFLEWAAASYTDYGDILVAPECSDEALQRLWRKLSLAGGFDLAFLNRLLPQSQTSRFLSHGSSGVTLRPNHRTEMSYRVAGSWQTGEQWFDGQSKKARKNYRRRIKFIEEVGKFRLRLLKQDEPLKPVLDRISMLKRKWLANKDLQSDLFVDGTSTLDALVGALDKAGILRIFVLECKGTIIAVSINFVQHNTMMAFITTYDPEFERASPGVVLMTDYIKWSIDQGLQTVDFLCGAEQFKQRFATQSVCLTSLMGAGTLRGSLAILVDRCRHAIKTITDLRRKMPETDPSD